MQRRWWRAIAGRVDAVVALTPQLEDEMRHLGYEGPVWLIRNTQHPERFLAIDRETEAGRLRHELGIAEDVPLLGFVGNLSRGKRPERTLDVLARVLAQGQAAHLVVAGDGPLRTMFENEARDRGLEAHMTSLGHRPDVERLLGGVDLLLITSDVEGIPGVAIEAQMAGCPVVTFPTGGVREVVEDGRTGVVVDRPDTALMTEHVLRLLRCPDSRQRLGSEGRQRADAFSTARVANDTRIAWSSSSSAGRAAPEHRCAVPLTELRAVLRCTKNAPIRRPLREHGEEPTPDVMTRLDEEHDLQQRGAHPSTSKQIVSGLIRNVLRRPWRPPRPSA